MNTNFYLQELEEFCFKFSLNHMTAIIQTEGFASLEEQTVKDFIRKAAKFGAFRSQDDTQKCINAFYNQKEIVNKISHDCRNAAIDTFKTD